MVVLERPQNYDTIEDIRREVTTDWQAAPVDFTVHTLNTCHEMIVKLGQMLSGTFTQMVVTELSMCTRAMG